MMAVVRLRHQLTMEARIIRTRFFSNAVSATWRLSFYGPLSRYAPSSKAASFAIDKPKKWENLLLLYSYRMKCHFFNYAFLVPSTNSIINWNRWEEKQVWCTLRRHPESLTDGLGKSAKNFNEERWVPGPASKQRHPKWRNATRHLGHPLEFPRRSFYLIE
jgi:hypothetical protein